MWHEARKQEKKIRDAMVDFQKRAERRREHYEKMVRSKQKNNTLVLYFSSMALVWKTTSLCIHVIMLSFLLLTIYFDVSILQKKDPTQLLRIYGTRCPLHLDPVANKQSNSM